MMKLQPGSTALSKLVAIPVLLLFSYSALAQDSPEIIQGNPDDAKVKFQPASVVTAYQGIEPVFPSLSVPMIAGQSEQYIITALNDYASGARSFPTMGR